MVRVAAVPNKIQYFTKKPSSSIQFGGSSLLDEEEKELFSAEKKAASRWTTGKIVALTGLASLTTGLVTKVLSDKGLIKGFFKKEAPLPELPDELALKTAKEASRWTYGRISVLSHLLTYPLDFLVNMSKWANLPISLKEFAEKEAQEKADILAKAPASLLFTAPRILSGLVSFTTGVISLFKK
jgi:hypothetical protein